jgi:hypothetical protein
MSGIFFACSNIEAGARSLEEETLFESQTFVQSVKTVDESVTFNQIQIWEIFVKPVFSLKTLSGTP